MRRFGHLSYPTNAKTHFMAVQGVIGITTQSATGLLSRGAIAPLDEKPAKTRIFSPFGGLVGRVG
jgi:hypothetical protein